VFTGTVTRIRFGISPNSDSARAESLFGEIPNRILVTVPVNTYESPSPGGMSF